NNCHIGRRQRQQEDSRVVKSQKSEGWPHRNHLDESVDVAVTWNKILLFDMPSIGSEYTDCNPSITINNNNSDNNNNNNNNNNDNNDNNSNSNSNDNNNSSHTDSGSESDNVNDSNNSSSNGEESIQVRH